MDSHIDLLKLRRDDNHRVVIVGSLNNNTGGGDDFLTSSNGIRLTEFASGGSNEFQSLFEIASAQNLQNALSVLKAAVDKGAETVGSDFKLPDIRLKKVEHTRLTWITSSTPLFVVQMLFIALEPGDDVRKEVVNLQRAVYPEIKGNTVNPPLGISESIKKGQFNVSIGKWFRAVNQVIRKVEFVYSREMVSPGTTVDFPTPLYAIGSVTFSPYEMPSAKDVRGYFPSVIV